MGKQQEIENKVNKVLESIDGIQRAEPAPFFYTRVRARLQRDEKNVWEVMGAFISRPAVALSGLLLVLALNGFMLFQKETRPSYQVTQGQEEETMMTASNSFDYENLEP